MPDTSLNPGIDWGRGASNADPETGIRYGVISQRSLMPEAASDFGYINSRDLSHEAAVEEIKKKLQEALDVGTTGTEDDKRAAFSSILGDISRRSLDLIDDLMEIEYGEGAVEEAWDIIQDAFNDHYHCEDPDWLYEHDGYKATNCLNFDVMLLASKFFTFAQFCSPCVPGAGNLDHPFTGKAVPHGYYKGWAEQFQFEAEQNGFAKCFCWSHDWFEGGRAPYAVFEVGTNKFIPAPCSQI